MEILKFFIRVVMAMVVSALLAGIFLSVALMLNQYNTASASGTLNMTCSHIVRAVHRCENQEVVCYLAGDGISCIPKTQTKDAK